MIIIKTARRKLTVKKSLLVDGQGGPLAIVVAPANVNDHVLLEETIEAVVVERPRPTEKEPQHLCLDAGYDNQSSRDTVKEHHYRGHIRPARGEQPSRKGHGQASSNSSARSPLLGLPLKTLVRLAGSADHRQTRVGAQMLYKFAA